MPLDPRATYIVVARHPLDMAVSLYHQGDNLDRERIAELTGQPAPGRAPPPRPPLADWLLGLDRLGRRPARRRRLAARRACGTCPTRGPGAHEPNVVLVHYDDLSADLEGEMRRLAGRLGIEVPEDRWPDLVDAADVRPHAGRADQLAPDPRAC